MRHVLQAAAPESPDTGWYRWMRLKFYAPGDRTSLHISEEVVKHFESRETGLHLDLSVIGAPAGSAAFMENLKKVLKSDRGAVALVGMEEMPLRVPRGLTIGAILKRKSRHDGLLSDSGYTRLPSGTEVWCNSELIAAQLLRARRDIRILGPGSGYEDAIQKVEEDAIAAAVMPAYKFEASGNSNSRAGIQRALPLDSFVPAAGQGAHALIASASSPHIRALGELHSQKTAEEVEVEMSLLEMLSAHGGMLPAVSCASFGSGYTLRMQLLSPDGRSEKKMIRNIGKGEDLSQLAHSMLR